MIEPLKWGLALVFTYTVYALVFYPGHDTVPETRSRHWMNDCRLLEKNIDKGFFLPHKTGFSVVMSLKMSMQMNMSWR